MLVRSARGGTAAAIVALPTARLESVTIAPPVGRVEEFRFLRFRLDFNEFYAAC